MAKYETLADGGHEHLVATVKSLVDQKANEHEAQPEPEYELPEGE